jgi:8-oxo-dGTP pyrophosphatase MutT (NUDIX family)|tara:strand:- start:982 stop:1386 length:405 start_codon:yes stop_codon:yes gene_type:complete
METDEPWVVVWAIPKNKIDLPCWLMVKHIERGWELPGGKQLENEENDVTALRELYEETGLLGVAISEDDTIIKGGVVVLVEINEEPEPYGWDSDDENIVEVGWCVEIPDDLYWGSKEIKKLINYDWSAARTFKS